MLDKLAWPWACLLSSNYSKAASGRTRALRNLAWQALGQQAGANAYLEVN